MKTQFTITGFYYEVQGIKFQYLDIKTINSGQKPDLMVIMMNPGSSKPLDDDRTIPKNH
jgi:hypothetical protein